MDLKDLFKGKPKEKKTQQLGGSNPQNIDSMVEAGILTKEEGEAAKKRLKEKEAKKKKQ